MKQKLEPLRPVGRKQERQLTDQSLKTLANSIYQTLKSEGCEHKDIIGVSSQLIGLVTAAMDEPQRK